MEPDVIDTGALIFKGTNSTLNIRVFRPDGTNYDLTGKTVTASIRREDRPSTDLGITTTISVTDNVATVEISAAESEKLQAPTDPQKSFAHLIQLEIETDDFTTDLIRFYVSKQLSEVGA